MDARQYCHTYIDDIVAYILLGEALCLTLRPQCGLTLLKMSLSTAQVPVIHLSPFSSSQ